MTSNSTHEFLSPVGGVPTHLDLIPSIVFAAFYACVLPFLIWRVAKPQTRHVTHFGRIGFTMERVVSFSLRAHAAQISNTSSISLGLLNYFQTLYALGYLALSQDILTFYRTTLVDATLGTSMRARYKALAGSKSRSRSWRGFGWNASESDSTTGVLPPGDRQSYESPGEIVLRGGMSFEESKVVEDLPHTRARVRQLCGIAALLLLVALVVGVVGWTKFKGAVTSGTDVTLMQVLSYCETGISIIVLNCISHSAVWLCFKMPRNRQSSAMWIVLLSFLVSVVATYRLVATRLTTSLFSADVRGTENSTGWKIAFYVFHIAPEFLSTAFLCVLDVRRVFASSLWGDLRNSDP